jgi:hypothetical protein
MLIYIKDAETFKIQIDFTEDELSNNKFNKTINSLVGNSGLHVKRDYPIVTVTPKNKVTFTNIGQLVDYVRELFIRDVVFEYDEQGEKMPKDLSECCQFTFTKHITQTPEEPEEPAVIEKPIKEVKDGSGVQESFLDSLRKTV